MEKETSKPTDLLFTTTTKFSLLNTENILIQGDSWAEAARMNEEYLLKFSKKKNWGLILGGISSYSPSPMSLQLDILRQDFYIRPSVVIAIIDQTDIGDEFFRYKKHYISNNGKLKALNKKGHNDRKNKIIIGLENNQLSKNLKVYKLIKHLYLQYLDSQLSIPGSDILSPLENGVTLDQNELFRSRLKTYIKTCIKCLFFIYIYIYIYILIYMYMGASRLSFSDA